MWAGRGLHSDRASEPIDTMESTVPYRPGDKITHPLGRFFPADFLDNGEESEKNASFVACVPPLYWRKQARGNHGPGAVSRPMVAGD